MQREHKDEKTTRAVQRAYRVLERSRDMVEGIYAFARSAAKPSCDASAPLLATILEVTSALRDAEGEGCPVTEVRDFEEAKRQSGTAYAAFFHAMLDGGVYLPPSPYEAWFLSAAHDDEAVGRIAEALPAAARAAAAALD